MEHERWAGLRSGPSVMGILNVTPDSFSDGGKTFDPAKAIDAGLAMVAGGADIIDVGGESTRPGAILVNPEDEQRRVLPVIAGLRNAGVPISVDTRNATTMAAALDLGATIVNDVSALSHDPHAMRLVADRACSIIMMHMRGTPATMATLAIYDDVAADVARELTGQVQRAIASGVARHRIAIDPGFGFAKNGPQNVTLLRALGLFCQLGLPVVVGVSRKRFLTMAGSAAPPDARGPESIAAALYAITQGASVVRVHDVDATVRALRVWKALSA